MPRPRNDAKCAVGDCDKKQRSLGYCAKHYTRFKLYGAATALLRAESNAGRPCAHCHKEVEAKDLCSRHYRMWLKHGDPLHSDQAARPYGRVAIKIIALHGANPDWPDR